MFGTQDLSSWTENLPTGYDLILSRDALQHLSYYSIAGKSSFSDPHYHYLRPFVHFTLLFVNDYSRRSFQVLPYRLKVFGSRILS